MDSSDTEMELSGQTIRLTNTDMIASAIRQRHDMNRVGSLCLAEGAIMNKDNVSSRTYRQSARPKVKLEINCETSHTRQDLIDVLKIILLG